MAVGKDAVVSTRSPEMRTAIHGAFGLEADLDGATINHGVRAFGHKNLLIRLLRCLKFTGCNFSGFMLKFS